MAVLNINIFTFFLLGSLLYLAHSDDLLTVTCWACYSTTGIPDMENCSSYNCSDAAEEDGVPAMYAFCTKTQMLIGGMEIYQAGCQVAPSLDDNSYCDELKNRTAPAFNLTACEQCRTDFCNSY